MGIGCDHLLSGRGRHDYALLRYLVLLSQLRVCQLQSAVRGRHQKLYADRRRISSIAGVDFLDISTRSVGLAVTQRVPSSCGAGGHHRRRITATRPAPDSPRPVLPDAVWSPDQPASRARLRFRHCGQRTRSLRPAIPAREPTAPRASAPRPRSVATLMICAHGATSNHQHRRAGGRAASGRAASGKRCGGVRCGGVWIRAGVRGGRRTRRCRAEREVTAPRTTAGRGAWTEPPWCSRSLPRARALLLQQRS